MATGGNKVIREQTRSHRLACTLEVDGRARCGACSRAKCIRRYRGGDIARKPEAPSDGSRTCTSATLGRTHDVERWRDKYHDRDRDGPGDVHVDAFASTYEVSVAWALELAWLNRALTFG